MSTLQLGLIVAGIVLVLAVVVYNGWQERRLRRRLDGSATGAARDEPERSRVEPTLHGRERHDHGDEEGDAHATAGAQASADAGNAMRGITEPPAAPFAIPMDEVVSDAASTTVAAAPDEDIECVAHVTLAQPADVATVAGAMPAPPGKPVRWLVRRGEADAWQPLAAATAPCGEIAGCLLLADRQGAAGERQVAAFLRGASDLARALGGAVAAPSAAEEARRAQALDRLCADLDIQIGLTVHKPDGASIAGTRLRGVAEAAGFRLAPGGRFEHLHEDTGAVLYTLQNARNEPLTAESLRVMTVQGVVFLLDVPRVHDPVRAFDQMKLAARRLAQTLGGELVDDNRRPLDDAALAKTRAQVQAAAAALSHARIEPGSARAQALFGA